MPCNLPAGVYLLSAAVAAAVTAAASVAGRVFSLAASFCLSEECMAEAQKITKGFKDEWVKPQNPKTLLDYAKPYGIPYGFDFNNEEIINLNRQKINNQ